MEIKDFIRLWTYSLTEWIWIDKGRGSKVSRSGEKGRTASLWLVGESRLLYVRTKGSMVDSRKSKIAWMVCPFWVIIGNIFMLFLHPNIEDSTFQWLSFILQHKPECWWLDKGKNSNVSHSGEQLSPMLYVRRNMFEQRKVDFFMSGSRKAG